MSDQPPVVVNATPGPDQINAGVRQFITALGPVVALLAQTPWGAKIGLTGYWAAIVSASGIIAAVVSIVAGQMKTRSMATKAIVMANAVPDTVATIR